MGIMERMRLDGKKTLVTGGARGIGKSIATALTEAGAEVAIVDINIETAEATANELYKKGKKVIAIDADVTDPVQVDRILIKIVKEFGELNVTFCNAGICINVPALEMTLEQWKKVLDVNLTGVFLVAQAAGKQMMKQGKGGLDY